MTTYVALLRGINLAGVNKVPMNELRSLFERLGHENVRTYLQSGNVIFDAPSSSTARLAVEIERELSRVFGLEISVIVRTNRELTRVASDNPFPTEGVKPSLLHVMFLAERVSARAATTLDPGRSPPDRFVVRGREVYLWFPHGSGRSKLSIDYFEKTLGTRATARNWNTIMKILELMERS